HSYPMKPSLPTCIVSKLCIVLLYQIRVPIWSSQMLIGYARVSTTDQNTTLQIDDIENAGFSEIYTDRFSGASSQRPELTQCLRHLRPGDTLVVWRLDRLARS